MIGDVDVLSSGVGEELVLVLVRESRKMNVVDGFAVSRGIEVVVSVESCVVVFEGSAGRGKSLRGVERTGDSDDRFGNVDGVGKSDLGCTGRASERSTELVRASLGVNGGG